MAIKGHDVTGKRRYLLDFSIDELKNGNWTTQLNARNIFGSYEEIVGAVVNSNTDRSRSFVQEQIDPGLKGLIQDQRDVRRALGMPE